MVSAQMFRQIAFSQAKPQSLTGRLQPEFQSITLSGPKPKTIQSSAIRLWAVGHSKAQVQSFVRVDPMLVSNTVIILVIVVTISICTRVGLIAVTVPVLATMSI